MTTINLPGQPDLSLIDAIPWVELIDQLMNDSSADRTTILRQSLNDPDPDNVRCAMWHLSRLRALTDNDIELLLSSVQPDRISAETLLALAMDPQPLVTGFDAEVAAKKGPLTVSVLRWSQWKLS